MSKGTRLYTKQLPHIAEEWKERSVRSHHSIVAKYGVLDVAGDIVTHDRLLTVHHFVPEMNVPRVAQDYGRQIDFKVKEKRAAQRVRKGL